MSTLALEALVAELPDELEQQTLSFKDVTTWLREVAASYKRYKDAGWEFVLVLRTGIDQFARTDQRKARLYAAAGEAMGVSAKTVQNIVSASRKPSTTVAMAFELELGHAVAVLGLPHDQAVDVLKTAAERSLSVEATRYEAQCRKGADDGPIFEVGYPDGGKSEPLYGEPPYNSKALYEHSDQIFYARCPTCGCRLKDEGSDG